MPTVTATTTAPPNLPADSPETVDPPQPDLEESGRSPADQSRTDAQGAAPGEPALEASALSAAGGSPTSSEPGQESGQDPGSIRPDGNMFAADVAAQEVIALDEPIDMAVAPDDDLLWIAERGGRVLRIDMERGEVVETVLDITAETETAGERGLLGIAVTDRRLSGSSENEPAPARSRRSAGPCASPGPSGSPGSRLVNFMGLLLLRAA